MSETKLISPLLDGFLMGSPMSDHNGVQCCPAMKEDSDHRYIVKIISVPASQKQLDALLLAGAYRRPEDAMEYFKELADGVASEAQCLQDLSKVEGFLPYEAWQIEPMERHDLGYQVYLLGSYKRSLEKHMRRTMLTHLDAINLGLDLCSALAAVRRAGYIYVDLKPTNIFLGEDKSCRIGDLGFISRDAFRYTALPGKYISRYTPPELKDPMADLNETVDTYALGMVLYQIYNDGQLPAEPENPEEGYPSPVNADYELAEIILKALSPKIEDRYQDPQEMGKALDCYMQRNSVNETPVTPPSTVIYDPEDMVKEEPSPQEPAEAPETENASPDEMPSQEAPAEEAPPEAPSLEEIQQEVQQEETEPPLDETMPTAEDAPLPEETGALSDEVSSMVAQADDLLTHEIPEGVEIPDPDAMDPFADFLLGEEDWTQVAQPPQEEFMPDPISEEQKANQPPAPKKPSKLKKILLRILITLIILGVLAGGGYYYIRYIYLQPIDSLTVEGTATGLTVTVKTDVDPSLLTVSCSDDALNVLRQPLVNGTAQFMELQPEKTYRIELEIDGFHKLIGETSVDFLTETQTSIETFTAAAGTEEGSVMLDFVIDGPEPNEWTVTCTTQGEPPREEVFSGHSITINGLTQGKIYTFLLGTDDDKVITGNNTAEFKVASTMTAKNLQITAENTDTLLVTWEIPSGSDVITWTVHCYNEEGYSETQEIFGTEARFSGVDPSMAYTVEVTAKDSNLPARATISANPIAITSLFVDDSEPGQLTLTWEYSGKTPEGGWLVSYGLDSTESQSVISCQEPKAVISPRIPGTTYYITISTPEDSSISGNTTQFQVAQPEQFNNYGLSASSVTVRLLKTPEDPEWTASTVSADSYTDTFQAGDPISLVLHAEQKFYLNKEDVTALYVLRDSEGRVLSKMTTREDINWSEMWMGGDYRDAEVDLPVAPMNAGTYSVTVYLNEAFFASAEFTITE